MFMLHAWAPCMPTSSELFYLVVWDDTEPDYHTLLSRAKSAHTLLSVAEQGTSALLGEPRKLRVGILKEGFHVPGT